jgi:hypothetical protein
MDKPKIKLTEEEAKKVEKLVEILESAYKSKGVVRRPPGRPGKIEKPTVKPSKIPRYMRIKITPDKLMQLVIPEKLKKLRKVVKSIKFYY